MTLDLTDAGSLKRLCEEIEVNFEAGEPAWLVDWRRRLAGFLEEVWEASPEVRRSPEFQRRLWDHNEVSGVGMGTVKIEPLVQSEAFRDWLAGLFEAPLPAHPDTRLLRLQAIHEEMLRRVRGHIKRTPRLKMFRIMAVLAPEDFTSLSEVGRMRALHGMMFSGGRGATLQNHVAVMRRLREVLGACEGSYEARAARMTLPWMLYDLGLKAQDEATTEIVGDERVEMRLKPLPAARRRRGLTSLGGYFDTVLGVLEGFDDGVTREDLLDHLRGLLPKYKQSSLNSIFSMLTGEFGVAHRQGDLYLLTEAGETVLETGEPDALAEWLLTRVLGVDHALMTLKTQGPIPRKALQEAIQAVNPGWTSSFAPSVMIYWLRSFELIEVDAQKRLVLTEAGQSWASQIHWTPEALPPRQVEEDEEEDEGARGEAEGTLWSSLPDFETIRARLTMPFARYLVAELHAGLWAHPRRHFAILTGLSGAGKTQLARQYALALREDAKSSRRLLTIPVQPGWYDPTPLLGYVNPLKPDSYVRTPFLEFLLEAIAAPGLPHVVLLDEMNLSRPEQYFAPLLSAMETGAAIDLHREREGFDGIPRRLPYPNNLVIMGTVNMDETTHGLSDKVLDRAFTLEFWHIEVGDFARWGQTSLTPHDEQQVRALLTELMSALRPARLHFGWRVMDDVLDFLERNQSLGGLLSFQEACDAVFYAKVIPKLRGDDSTRFREALERAEGLFKRFNMTRCQAKVGELRHDLELTGSARFWR